MPRLPIGPANVAPPLRCERLEDRSLLSTSSLTSVLVDRAFVEMVSCIETPADGVVMSEGGTAIRDDEFLSTLEWMEGSDRFIADEWYSEDELYYEDGSWYYEEELVDDGSWAGEEDGLWHDDWYYDEELFEGEWYSEDEFVDSDGMTQEEYEQYWADWDRSEVIPAPNPHPDDGEWSWTQRDFDNSVVLDEGMVYTMTLAGGIAVMDAPATPAIAGVIELLPLPVPVQSPETDAGLDVAPALPPTAAEPVTLSDTEEPAVVESAELPAPVTIEQAESDEAAAPVLVPLTVSDDHLADAESLELSEDLPVG